MATGVGRGRICLASLIAQPQKPPVIRKNLRDISNTSRVIADFVPNFVAMATGVGRGRICLASFNSPTPKTPCYTQRSPGYLLHKSSYTLSQQRVHDGFDKELSGSMSNPRVPKSNSDL